MNCCNKIALLIPYYGEFPWYFHLFLGTCSYNKDVDFKIFTDTIINFDIPKNVSVIRISFKELKVLIQDKLDMTISMERPYKLCDFRPAFGKIFEDYLLKYDFWGHCDIDVLFGRIRVFLTDELLNKYDTISVRKEFTTGFFSLYRNTKRINMLFKESTDYQYVFSSEKNFCFDECSTHHKSLISGKQIEQITFNLDAITFVIARNHKKGNINAYYNMNAIEYNFENLIWYDGKIIVNGRFEAILFHFMSIKANEKNIRKSFTIANIESIEVVNSEIKVQSCLSNASLLNTSTLMLNNDIFYRHFTALNNFEKYSSFRVAKFSAC
ncbi:DUF6625 family protein [Sphingobacterium sp. R2]|uniref:DUF6625 family protein n=1 Tax=Sphingobacterium sp. R2 TaxID=3112958 RepID=UPI00345D1AFC